MIEHIVQRVERELDVREMIDAAPSVIRHLQAERIVRAVFRAMADHYCDRPMLDAGRDAIYEYTGLPDEAPHICDAVALAEVTFRAMMKAAAEGGTA